MSSSSTPASTAIPSGSWVLVTGANGFLASHVTKEFLKRGFKVRGAVRDVKHSSWLLQDDFKPFADTGALELVNVPDLAAPGAYVDAVRGVSSIAHVATIAKFVADPNEIITPAVAGVRSIMEAAKNEPSVKEVVFTSSGFTAISLGRGVTGTVERDTWNDAVLEAAWAPPPYEPMRAAVNYPASKVAAEKEVWRFARENKDELGFTVNVVSPSSMIGELLNKKHLDHQANYVAHAYRGNKAFMDTMQASYYVNVKDVALLHVASVLDHKVKNARLQTWGHSANWNDILAILRKLRPEKKFIDDYPDPYHLSVDLDQSDSLALLQKWAGQGGWTSLEESVRGGIDNPYFEE